MVYVPGGVGKKILVVDDETAVSELLQECLTKEGFKVQTAPNGETGLKRAKEFGPDLILLDVNMGGISGFEVLKALKADEKTMSIPVFMLTARADETDVEQGIRGYADKYITKPFNYKDLVDEIRKTLTLRQSHRR